MKRWDLFFAVILVPIDYAALLVAGIVAYYLRYAEFFAARRPVIFTLPFEQYVRIAGFVALGWIVIFALSGLYTIGARGKKLAELKKIILASTTALGILLAVLVFSRELFESRFILLASWGFAIICVGAGRLFVRIVHSTLLRFGIGLKRIVVIGTGAAADAIVRTVMHNPRYGCMVLARASQWTPTFENELRARAERGEIDQVIALTKDRAEDELHRILDFTNEYHIPFRYSADMLASYGAGLEFDMFAGVPLVELKRTRLEGWGKVYKRIFDILGSIVLIVLTSPIMILAALAILFETGLPILFRNERAGEHGREFAALKFRTMFVKYCIGGQFPDREQALEYEKELIEKQSIKEGPVYKIKDDPRVTRVGKFLRRASIDELPQLFNVLSGKMSLVGPRPHQKREIEQYEKHHKRVLEIKPGITGLPQISGRSDLSFEEEVKLDTYYIEHWSLKIDFIILLKTPFAVLGQKGTY